MILYNISKGQQQVRANRYRQEGLADCFARWFFRLLGKTLSHLPSFISNGAVNTAPFVLRETVPDESACLEGEDIFWSAVIATEFNLRIPSARNPAVQAEEILSEEIIGAIAESREIHGMFENGGISYIDFGIETIETRKDSTIRLKAYFVSSGRISPEVILSCNKLPAP